MNTNMEKNIAAAFVDKQAMELATEALRKQGVIDIQILPPVRASKPRPFDKAATDSGLLFEMAEDYVYPLNVYVEKSRFRQAEDTIVRYGGQF